MSRCTPALVVMVLWACAGMAQVGVESSPLIQAPTAAPGLISTPIVDLNQISTAPAGARNATADNRAGATNATLDNVPPAKAAVSTEAELANGMEEPVASGEGGPSPANARTMDIFNSGVGDSRGLSSLPGGKSLGELAAAWRMQKQNPIRTISNADVAGLSLANLANNEQPASVASVQGSSSPSPTQAAELPQPRREADAPVDVAQAGTVPEPEPQREAAEGNLPRASSNLPSLALLGCAGVLTGFLVRWKRH